MMEDDDIKKAKTELELAGYSFTDEEIKQIIEAVGEAIEKVIDCIKQVAGDVAASIKQVSEMLSKLSTEEQKTFCTKFVKEQEILKAKSNSLNLDKRPKIHFCRNKC